MTAIQKNIAFIGLGNMGLPMASNLANAGHSVFGFDPQVAQSQPDLPEKLHICTSLEDAVKNSDLVITMLPNGKIVLDVIGAIFQLGATPDVILDCSTIDINDARAAHDLTAEKGINYMDAPVSGGISGAAAGTLTTMIGGDPDVLSAIKPRIEPMFKTFIHCGDGGSGQAAKICNNMLLATTMIGTGETFNLGKKLGLDMNTLFNVLSTSTGSCWAVNSYCPLPGVGPTSPADNNYKPGFSVEMMLKDLHLTQTAADSAEQATPLGAHALELYQLYANASGTEEDFSGIVRYLAELKRN